MFFRSPQALGSELEGWFEDEDYQAWDGRGRRLVLVAEESPRPRRRRRSRLPLLGVRLSETRRTRRESFGSISMLLGEVGAGRPVDASVAELVLHALMRGDLK